MTFLKQLAYQLGPNYEFNICILCLKYSKCLQYDSILKLYLKYL